MARHLWGLLLFTVGAIMVVQGGHDALGWLVAAALLVRGTAHLTAMFQRPR